MTTTAEQRRQKIDILRFGTVAEVDHPGARCRIASGDIVTDWIPWMATHAAATSSWSAPAAGEQGLLACPDGDLAGAVFLRGLYSDAHPAPAADGDVHLLRFPDGTVVRYDHAAHAMRIELAAGGTCRLIATGGVTIDGDVQVNGTVRASGDCVASGISLAGHTHAGVQAGSGRTGAPG